MSIILSNLNFKIPNIQDRIHYNFHTQSDDCILMHAQSQSDSSWLKCYCWRGSRSVEEYSRKPLSNAATWGKFVFVRFLCTQTSIETIFSDHLPADRSANFSPTHLFLLLTLPLKRKPSSLNYLAYSLFSSGY